MRYIGGKSLLLDNILNVIKDNTADVKTVIDIFAGSGAVSKCLKENGYKVYSNDFLYFSYVLNRGTLDINKKPKFEKLNIDNPITYLNNLKIEDTDYELKDCFIYNNYSPHDKCERMYFTTKNAIKIDIIRRKIEEWFRQEKINEDEYFYLLSSLIAAVPYVSNTAGVYGAYLKFWDKRAKNNLVLTEPELVKTKTKSFSYNLDCNALIKDISADLLYADPPYNSRQYLPNYHLLETIAKYDNPVLTGVTGMRDYSNQKSEFCQKGKAKKAFEDLIKNAKVKYVVISYNNEGILSTEELTSICKKYSKDGTFNLLEIDYRRYKNKVQNNTKCLKEQLYFFEKKTKVYDKSPLNYIGGKYKILPQIMEYFPTNVDVMVDLFAGGCDVCSNFTANKIYANDINSYIIEIYKKLQGMTIDEVLSYIDTTIKAEKLSIDNKETYLAFREKYNKTKNRNPLDLYILMCYAFNYQCRFNNHHEFNSPFGKDRSSFNSVMRNNLIKFHNNIKDIEFSAFNFKDFDTNILKKGDFLYADPPYLITTGSYNDGKRGFEGWTKKDDAELLKLLDKLNDKGVRFALSNVIEHKGLKNDELIAWMKKYKTHYINFNYKNSNYHGKNTDKQTVEVLITNY